MADDPNVELMSRVTLTFTLDQVLLEVEAKSEATGRLYNGRFRKDVAASFHRAIADRLDGALATKTSIPLRVNRDNFSVMADQ